MELKREKIRIIDEMISDFQKNAGDDPEQWALKKIMEIKGVSEEEASKILSNIISGIKTYREIREKSVESKNKVINKLKEEDEQKLKEKIKEISREFINKLRGMKNEQ